MDIYDHHDLTELQMTILDFEAQRPVWRDVCALEASIRAELGLSPAHYQQILDALLEHPPAAVYAPQTVTRLRHLREPRGEHRSPDIAS